jgi:dienelactone hydrolase
VTRFTATKRFTGVVAWAVLALVARPSDARSGLPAARIFTEDGIKHVMLSPDGSWILAHGVQGGLHGLLIQGRGFPSSRAVFSAPERIVQTAWVGRDRYVASFWTRNGHRQLLAGRIVEQTGKIDVEHAWITAPGALVAPLPLVDETVIWAMDYHGRSSLHRVELDELAAFHEQSRFANGRVRLGKQIASLRGSVETWVVDRNGHPRAALRADGDGFTLLTRAEGETHFEEIYRFETADPAAAVQPVSLTLDEERLIVLAYGGGDTMGLFEFDMESGRILEPIFTLEDADVTRALLDPITGELIAAIYTEEGEKRFHYFHNYAHRHLQALRGAFPKQEIAVVSGNAHRTAFIFRVTGPRNPGAYYLLDRSTGETTPIATVSSDLNSDLLVEVEAIEVQSQDGTRIEAFLALPREVGPEGVPLVVEPHGGPIGVRDTKDFDRLVQYLASWGFAVLQVNYRGSEGYGRTFLEAGKRQWAKGIEDDIDAAVEAVLARPQIDASRVCIIGASYGGFSAVASVVRHRNRYRCAATLNGVSDIPLVFEESDCADSERCARFWKDAIGDPDTDRAGLVDRSPAYHVRDIETPIFVSYGTEDVRVDPDHSHRLILMLETLGKEHRVLEIEGAEHGLTMRERAIYARALRRFLTRYLFPGTAFVKDPGDFDATGREPVADPPPDGGQATR